jgi:hypothetical protein
MMGHRQVEEAALFYAFSLEKHVPADHLLRSVDRFVDLQEIRQDLAPFYSSIGRPSIDPELMIRMLLIGYCYGIRSERRLCDGGSSQFGLSVVLPARPGWGGTASLIEISSKGVASEGRCIRFVPAASDFFATGPPVLLCHRGGPDSRTGARSKISLESLDADREFIQLRLCHRQQFD